MARRMLDRATGVRRMGRVASALWWRDPAVRRHRLRRKRRRFLSIAAQLSRVFVPEEPALTWNDFELLPRFVRVVVRVARLDHFLLGRTARTVATTCRGSKGGDCSWKRRRVGVDAETGVFMVPYLVPSEFSVGLGSQCLLLIGSATQIPASTFARRPWLMQDHRPEKETR
jgi:hypothetical protein